MCVVGDNCVVLHDHNKPGNLYSYHPKDGQGSAKTVDAAVEYQDQKSGQKFILMINQAIQINGLESHLLSPMQCCLSCMYIIEVTKFLAESHSVTTHAIELTDTFDETHLLIIPLQLSHVTSYFVVYSSSKAEYENEDICKIPTEESPWDLLTNIIKVRSASLPQQKGDHYISVQLSYTHWLMMLLML